MAKSTLVRALLLALMLAFSTLQAGLTGPEFTYQGELLDGGSPASGNWDFEFELWDSGAGGSSVSSTVSQTLMVNSGIFTTEVDFGPDPFDGDELWLEIRARPMGGGGFTTLVPRQQITAAPYALRAQSISASCPEGSAIRSVAPDGTPTCQPSGGDSYWSLLGDNRIEADRGVRIQPDPSADFPFTIRHDSNILSSQAYLVETSPSDYARLSFYNDNTLERFWTIAARVAEAGAGADSINFYNSGASEGGGGADIMTIDGDRRVGINNTNPQSALHVSGGQVRFDDLAHGVGILRPVMVDQFGELTLGAGEIAPVERLTYPPASFHPGGPVDDYEAGFGARIMNSDEFLYAPVLLPNNAIVYGFEFRVGDNAAGQSLTCHLYKVSLSSPNPQVILNPQTQPENDGPSVQVLEFSDPENGLFVIDNTAFAYYFRIGVTPGPWPDASTSIGLVSASLEYYEVEADE